MSSNYTCKLCHKPIKRDDRFCRWCSASNVTNYGDSFDYYFGKRVEGKPQGSELFFSEETPDTSLQKSQKTSSTPDSYDQSYASAFKDFEAIVKERSPYRYKRMYLGEPLGLVIANYNPDVMGLWWDPGNPDTFGTVARKHCRQAFEKLMPQITHYSQVHLSVRENDLQWAIRNFKDTSKTDEYHEFDGVYLNISVCYFLLSQPKHALDTLESHFKDVFQDTFASYLQALIYKSIEQIQEVVEIIEVQKVILKDIGGFDQFPFWYRLEADILERLGKNREAEEKQSKYRDLIGSQNNQK